MPNKSIVIGQIFALILLGVCAKYEMKVSALNKELTQLSQKLEQKEVDVQQLKQAIIVANTSIAEAEIRRLQQEVKGAEQLAEAVEQVAIYQNKLNNIKEPTGDNECERVFSLLQQL